MQMSKVEINLGGPQVTQEDASVNRQVGVLESRMPGEAQVGTAGNRVQQKISSDFVVEGYVSEMQIRGDLRFGDGTRGLRGKVQLAGNLDSRTLNRRNLSQIEISAGQT